MFSSHVPQTETNAWFKHHAKSLPKGAQEHRTYIEDMTGCIPLLLQPLFGMEEFDEMEFLRCKELQQVVVNTTCFYDVLFEQSSRRRQER